MSGRQPHGRTIRQDLKHSLPSYTNINLFRDCATEQSQAAREDERYPPVNTINKPTLLLHSPENSQVGQINQGSRSFPSGPTTPFCSST